MSGEWRDATHRHASFAIAERKKGLCVADADILALKQQQILEQPEQMAGERTFYKNSTKS